MNIAALFSGGKDSTFALGWAQQQGWEVKGLVTLTSDNPESWMFHTPNIWVTRLQAECLGLPHLFWKTAGEKEAELDDLRAALAEAKKRWALDGLVTGAVASNYQEERINRVCEELGLKVWSPLWHKDQAQLVEEMIAGGFSMILQGIAGDGLTEKDLGAPLDRAMLDRLQRLHQKTGIHVGGEGGEYESLVLDGPIFHKPVVVKKAHAVMDGECSGLWVIDQASLS